LLLEKAVSETEDQRLHRLMLERMQKVYVDDSYEDPELTRKFVECEIKINKNAAALVIICTNKLF
jgi:hypothetical protein